MTHMREPLREQALVLLAVALRSRRRPASRSMR